MKYDEPFGITTFLIKENTVSYKVQVAGVPRNFARFLRTNKTKYVISKSTHRRCFTKKLFLNPTSHWSLEGSKKI